MLTSWLHVYRIAESRVCYPYQLVSFYVIDFTVEYSVNSFVFFFYLFVTSPTAYATQRDEAREKKERKTTKKKKHARQNTK